jgi:2-desacetyl-2-hydroxyethyl bacteriochlorophyllide A dehydrogenase
MRAMIAAVFYGIKEGIKVEEVLVPEIKKPEDILIEVKACGLCGTDPAILEGRHPASPPVILGHEYTGIVVDVGDTVKTVKPGDHVVIDPNIKCGKCYYCRSGKQNLCENMTTLGIYIDGGFAEYNVAPESAVYKIPDDMEWKDAALVEPVSCVINGVTRARIRTGDHVVIIGAGPIGLIWIALAKKKGARVVVSEVVERRREAALKVGADIVINPRERDIVQAVRELTGGRGADIAVEAVGLPVTVRQTIEMLAYGGRAVIFGTCAKEVQIPISPYDIMRHEKEIIGSFIANFTFEAAINAMYTRLVPSEVLFTHELKVSEIHKALEIHKRGESIKILLKP